MNIINKAYLITFNKLFFMDTSELLELVFNSRTEFIKRTAIRILIDDERLIDNDISNDKLISLIDHLILDDLWILANQDGECIISRLAREKVLQYIDESFIIDSRDRIHLVK